MFKFIKAYIRSIFILGLVTLVFLTIYAAAQQNLRQSADDPQIQAAEDVSTRLFAGVPPQNMVSANNPMDISRSLSPFIVIFDGSGKPVISSAQLNGTTPVPPAGVFAYARQHGEDRFTWQPDSKVREAAVLIYSPSSTPYFVLVARSLREVENREERELAIAIGGWLIAIAGYLGFMGINNYLPKKIA
jgi:hypothetical protein